MTIKWAESPDLRSANNGREKCRGGRSPEPVRPPVGRCEAGKANGEGLWVIDELRSVTSLALGSWSVSAVCNMVWWRITASTVWEEGQCYCTWSYTIHLFYIMHGRALCTGRTSCISCVSHTLYISPAYVHQTFHHTSYIIPYTIHCTIHHTLYHTSYIPPYIIHSTIHQTLHHTSYIIPYIIHYTI